MVDDDVLYRFRLRLFSARRRSSATCARPAASSASTARPTTAGGDRCCARASRCSGRGSAGHRGCPTRRASSSSSASWPSRSASRARSAAHQRDARPGALGRHRHQSQRRLAGAPTPWPVAPHQPPALVAGYAAPPGPEPVAADRSSAMSRSTTRASWSASTASMWPAVEQQRPGLAVPSHRPRQLVRLGGAAHDAAQPVGGSGRASWPSAWRPTCEPTAGASSGCSPTSDRRSVVGRRSHLRACVPLPLAARRCSTNESRGVVSRWTYAGTRMVPQGLLVAARNAAKVVCAL